MSARTRTRLIMAGIGAAVLVAYLPALFAGFVWDDSVLVDDVTLHRFAGIWDIWLNPTEIDNEGHYWPLTYTTLWLEHQIWGLWPTGYHATNIALHIVNSLLVWQLLRRLEVRAAAAIALVFAVHPLHVESVAWIIERKDVLSGALYLASLLCWVSWTEQRHADPQPADQRPTRQRPTSRQPAKRRPARRRPADQRRARYGASLALYGAAVLAKSVAVTLPAALLIIQWYRNGRISRADLVRSAPFFATGAALALGDLLYYSGRERLDLGYSLVERGLIAVRALWFYSQKILWPIDLQVIYPHWEVTVADAVGWTLAAVTAGALAALWQARQRIGRGPLAAVLFFGVTLAPTLGIVQYGYMQFSFVADRFQYLAGIGAIALVVAAGAAALEQIGTRWAAKDAPASDDADADADATAELAAELVTAPVSAEPGADGTAAGEAGTVSRDTAGPGPTGRRAVTRQRVAVGVLVLVAVPLAAATWQHTRRWSDGVTLFSYIAGVNPDARFVHANLASALFGEERYEEGLKVNETALERNPEDDGVWSNAGQAHFKLKQYDEAERMLKQALALKPASGKNSHELGNVYRAQERYDEAITWYRKALELHDEPEQSAISHAALGIALYRSGDHTAAFPSLERALDIDPSLQSREGLARFAGLAARDSGNFAAARDYLEAAANADPDNPQIARALAGVLASLGQSAQAQALLASAADRSDNPERTRALYHIDIGHQMRSQGRNAEAAAAYRQAIDIGESLATAYAGLGDTLYRLGDYQAAIEAMTAALELGVSADGTASDEAPRNDDEALARGNDLDPIDPENAKALHYLIGDAYRQLGDNPAAVAGFEAALDIDPEFGEALDSLARLHFELADYETALGLFERLVALQADGVDALTSLGATQFHLGRTEAAIATFDRVLAIDPTQTTARDNRQEALRKLADEQASSAP